MKNKTTSERLIMALDRLNMKAQELSDRSGVNKASISQYVNGTHAPSNISAGKMASVLGVSPVWLMGFDVPMFDNLLPNYSNIASISTQSLPVLGKIACGTPKFMDEDRSFYVKDGTSIKADFVLIASGDSMVNARINDGDLVFIHQQPVVENGDIAAVAIGDDATLKRIYYYQDKSLMILKAENPKYEDMIYSGEELEDVRILGKAVAFQSDVF